MINNKTNRISAENVYFNKTLRAFIVELEKLKEKITENSNTFDKQKLLIEDLRKENNRLKNRFVYGKNL